jgi:hypothetical protein
MMTQHSEHKIDLDPASVEKYKAQHAEWQKKIQMGEVTKPAQTSKNSFDQNFKSQMSYHALEHVLDRRTDILKKQILEAGNQVPDSKN